MPNVTTDLLNDDLPKMRDATSDIASEHVYEDGLLVIRELRSKQYRPRTLHNAGAADLTVAIAEDFESAGEKLTRKAAGERYVAIHMSMPALDAARLLFRAFRYFDGRVLNVAGNSLSTLKGYGWLQESADLYVYSIVEKMHAHRPIEKIINGGQTGIDLSGAIVGVALGIPTVVTMPRGFIQRHEAHSDTLHSPDDVAKQVLDGAAKLKEAAEAKPSPSLRP
jgi:hypothetical protein